MTKEQEFAKTIELLRSELRTRASKDAVNLAYFLDQFDLWAMAKAPASGPRFEAMMDARRKCNLRRWVD